MDSVLDEKTHVEYVSCPEIVRCLVEVEHIRETVLVLVLLNSDSNTKGHCYVKELSHGILSYFCHEQNFTSEFNET